MNKYKPVGKIGEGTFSDVLKTLSLRDGNYYACKHMKQHLESDKKAGSLSLIHELMDKNIYELIKVFSLFPGPNELDQISKIHDVIGTPANKTLDKFKQSRIVSFDFPFKKGKGIPRLVHNLYPKGFSLLYAMIKYDPDERTAAHQALQHPYFQELWQVASNRFSLED